MKTISKIEKHLTIFWEEETGSIIVKWHHFFVEPNKFVNSLQKTISFAKENHTKAWIVDASEAISLINKELLTKMEKDIIPKLKMININIFISIIPRDNSFAQLTEQRYRNEIKKIGITAIVANSIEDAINYLKKTQ